MNNDTNNTLGGTAENTPNVNNIDSLNTGDVVTPNPVGTDTGNGPVNPGQSVVMDGSNANASEVLSNEQVVAPNTVIDNNTSQTITPDVGAVNQNGNGLNQSPVEGVPTPTVEPAYTNPQTLNPTPGVPMPGFENDVSIGTTPPVSSDSEKTPKKKGVNKTLFIVIIIVLICAVGAGTYFILQTGILNSGSNVTIKTKEVNLELGEELPTNINSYADISGTNTSNCSVDASNIDFNTEGTYEFTVTCGELVQTGTATVIDTSELIVTTKTVYLAVGDTVSAEDFIVDSDGSITYEFADSEAVNTYLQTTGTYTLTINATSGSRSTEAEAKLVVLETPIKGYVICRTEAQTINDISASMVVKEKFAYLDDDDKKYPYAGIAEEIHEFTFTDETVYTNYLAEYYTNGSLTINDVTGTPSFDEESLMITLTNERDNEEVISEYSEINMETRETIVQYFTVTLHYNCSLPKVE